MLVFISSDHVDNEYMFFTWRFLSEPGSMFPPLPAPWLLCCMCSVVKLQIHDLWNTNHEVHGANIPSHIMEMLQISNPSN